MAGAVPVPRDLLAKGSRVTATVTLIVVLTGQIRQGHEMNTPRSPFAFGLLREAECLLRGQPREPVSL